MPQMMTGTPQTQTRPQVYAHPHPTTGSFSVPHTHASTQGSLGLGTSASALRSMAVSGQTHTTLFMDAQTQTRGSSKCTDNVNNNRSGSIINNNNMYNLTTGMLNSTSAHAHTISVRPSRATNQQRSPCPSFSLSSVDTKLGSHLPGCNMAMRLKEVSLSSTLESIESTTSNNSSDSDVTQVFGVDHDLTNDGGESTGSSSSSSSGSNDGIKLSSLSADVAEFTFQNTYGLCHNQAQGDGAYDGYGDDECDTEYVIATTSADGGKHRGGGGVATAAVAIITAAATAAVSLVVSHSGNFCVWT